MKYQTQPLQPILAMMTYRGGARLTRCLESIAESEHHFKRIIFSVTASENSDDMHQCREFQRNVLPRAEVICTGQELPTMQHQAFWVTYLEQSGTRPSDWIYWLSYDDGLFLRGINQLTDRSGRWPLVDKTMYLGPWAMRHEAADVLWTGNPNEPLEVWTCLPLEASTGQSVPVWTSAQLQKPTYIQMSGSLVQFSAFRNMRDRFPSKTGPMRIEAALANDAEVARLQELEAPPVIIYGRSNSDRANYSRDARSQDVDLVIRIMKRFIRHPKEAFVWLRALPGLLRALLLLPKSHEDRIVKSVFQPMQSLTSDK